MSQKIKTSVEIDGSLSASQIANATIDTDKFLVSDGGVIKYRTGAELATDLGVSAGTTSKVQHQVKAGVAINKGQAVYVTGADGTNMIVGLASNATEATSSKTMGLLNATVNINGFADVITEGLLSGLDTSSAVAGNPVWLGTGGNLIYGLANKPYAPSHLVFIGIVTRVNANNGEIFVKVQNGFELDELHDVDLKTTTPINGHLLGFNGTLWVNKTIAGWLGYTPQAQLNGTGFVKASGTTITYDNTSYYPASNPSGYISTYTETDTLASVTGRGNTTTSNIFANGVRIGRTFSLANRATVRLDSNGDFPADVLFGRDVNYADSSWNGVFWSLSSRGSNESNSFRLYRGIANTGTSELVVLDVSTGGSISASGDFRAPIFYDSNNTSYYVDPASTSNLNALTLAGAFSAPGYNKTNWDTAYSWGNHASAGYATSGHTHDLMRHSLRAPNNVDSLTSSNFRDQLFGTSSNGWAMSTARWNSVPSGLSGMNMYGTMFAWAGSDTHGFIATDYSTANIQVGGGSGNSITWRATLIHSSNIGSYALTSYTETDTLATVTGRGATTSTRATLNGGWTVPDATMNYVGNFSTNDYSTMRFMSRAWADVQGANGLAYTFNTHTNVGSGGYGALQIYYGESGYVYAPTSFRAPIFYDSNDTGYYVDPASYSRLNQLSIGTVNTSYSLYNNGNSYFNGAVEIDDTLYVSSGYSARAPIFYDINDTGYYLDPASNSRLYRMLIHRGIAGGGQNIFSGLEGVETANGRGQLVISSSYSDLVIASSQANNQHGSTLSFTAYNPDNVNSYRKFVINQGNWGTRKHMLSFGYSDTEQTNPHNAINSGVNTLTLDGLNRRVGIKKEDPAYPLDIDGIVNTSSGYISAGNPWGTANSAFFPNGITTAGGTNWVYGQTYIGNAPGNGAGHEFFTSGSMNSTGTHSATIYYDYNNSGYYLDPASSSNINNLAVAGTFSGANNVVYGDGPNGRSKSMSNGNANTSDSSNSSGFYFGTNVTGMPGSDWWNWLTVAGNSWAGSDGYRWQMTGSFWSDDWRLRRMTSGSWNGWVSILHSGNYSGYAWPLEGSWKPSSLASSTRLRGATSPDGGEFGLAYSGGQIHPYTDGFFYQNEGQYRVIDSSSIASQSVNYANSSGSSSFSSRSAHLDTAYVGGQQLNPQTYFNNGIGLKAAMTAKVGVWSDTLWINGYSGSDVLWMCALHTQRNSAPRMYISAQQSTSSSYGTAYEFLTEYNYSDYAMRVGGGAQVVTGIKYFTTNNGGYCGALSDAVLEAYSSSNNSAYMSFHKGGHYAVNMGLDADNVMRIGGWSAASNRWQLDMSGNMTVAGDVTAYSDLRVKENIETIEKALDKVLSLRGVTYNRTDSEDKSEKIGVIAQEVQNILPQVVHEQADGMLGVSYGNITAVLIEAIKEQQAQIEELKQLVNKLTNK